MEAPQQAPVPDMDRLYRARNFGGCRGCSDRRFGELALLEGILRGHRQIKLDGNHNEILKGLRDWGAAAESTAAVGKGFPDIIASYAGRTVLFEVKDPAQKPSARRLTDDEVKFHASWRGNLAVVETIEQACKAMQSAVEFLS